MVRVSKNKTTRMVIKLADFWRKSCGMMRPRFSARVRRDFALNSGNIFAVFGGDSPLPSPFGKKQALTAFEIMV
jgi:hypothetical protein